jgi:RHS repeat-associated protein
MKWLDRVGIVLACGLAAAFACLWFGGSWTFPEKPPSEPTKPSQLPVTVQPVAGKSLAGLSWRFERDDDGMINLTTDPSGRSIRIRRTWHAKNVLAQLVKELPDGSRVVHQFDRRGRRLSRTDSTGTVRFEYDDENRLKAVHRQGGPSLRYRYDSQGRLQSLSLGEGLTVAYRYDFLGRLDRIETPAGTIAYDYQTGTGNVVRKLPNGFRSTWHFLANGRLGSLFHTGLDNHIVSRLTFAYRPDGLLREVKEWTPAGEKTVAYDYDTTMRLTTVIDSSAGKTVYKYDKLGNRTEVISPKKEKVATTYDWASRMLTHNGKESKHDAVGNLTDYVSSRGPAHFGFTIESLLATARRGATELTYHYDGDGNMVTRLQGGKKTEFLADAGGDVWRPLFVSSGGRSTLYVWEGNTPLAAISRDRTRFFLHDHLGSVTLVADPKGELQGPFEYGPFGEPRRTDETDELRPAYKGLFYDAQARLYLTHDRNYDPELGRYLQRNPGQTLPTGSQTSLSPYAYAGNNPINASTESGLPGVAKGGLNFQDKVEDLFKDVGGAVFQESGGGQVVNQGAAQGSSTTTAANSQKPPSDVLSIYTKKAEDAYFNAQTPQGKVAAGALATILEIEPALEKTPVLKEFIPPAKEFAQIVYNRPPVMTDINNKFAAVIDNWLGSTDSGGGINLPPPSGPPAKSVLQQIRDRVPDFAPQIPGAVSTSQPRGMLSPTTSSASTSSGSSNSASSSASGGSTYNPRLTMVDTPKNSGLANSNASSWQAMNTNKGYASSSYSYDNSPNGNKQSPVGTTKISSSSSLTNNSPSVGYSSGSVGGKKGGVDLRGAGKSLKGLGPLQGLAVDGNGRLILIAQKKGSIELPPLRLEDVATVFRCVYEHGDAPSVSIDPDADDPHGPLMRVRHGKGTPGTYVGWVLFEADRVMKTYFLGTDNVTRKPVHSSIPTYKNLLQLGFELDNLKEKGPPWERFWIVPASVHRLRTKDGRLTLFDLPLKVRTEASIVRNGRYERDPDGKSTKAALRFAEWFTEHYDDLARQVRSLPPQGSGMDQPVPVFAEMKRIALIAAVAESLRDQGIPMPAWMIDYPVTPFPVPESTPTLSVKLDKVINNRSYWRKMFGGVTLSPPTEAIRTSASAPRAESMAPALSKAVKQQPLLTPVAFSEGGKDYEAVALPGDDTLDVGALRLSETDLELPVREGATINLSRAFDSFHQPSDCLGGGWTLDAPRLHKQKLVTSRTAKLVYSRNVYQLTSPLDSFSETFTERKLVAAVNAYLLAPRSSRDYLGILERPDGTASLYFPDRREWQFDGAGRLAAAIQREVTVKYRWDKNGRLDAIEGWLEGTKKASIQLGYDGDGRLTTARGSDSQAIRYDYDSSGRLSRVKRPTDSCGYRYEEGRVMKVLHNGHIVRRFEYSEGGRVRRERGPGGEANYSTMATASGVEFTVTRDEAKSREVVRYDPAYRLLSRDLPNGTKMHWEYPKVGGERMTAVTPQGNTWTTTRGADGHQVAVLSSSQGEQLKLEQDGFGRVTSVWEGDKQVLKLQWRNDGLPSSVTTANGEYFPHYDDKGGMKEVFMGGQKSGTKYAQWARVKCDSAGRPKEFQDQYGLAMHLHYDPKGALSGWSNGPDKVSVKRTPQGRVESVESSWGQRQHNTFAPNGGDLRSAEFRDGESRAVLEFDRGRPIRLHQFDGGEVRIAYHQGGAASGRPRELRNADGLIVGFRYSVQGRLDEVDCGAAYRVRYTYDKRGRVIGVSEGPTR